MGEVVTLKSFGPISFGGSPGASPARVLGVPLRPSPSAITVAAREREGGFDEALLKRMAPHLRPEGEQPPQDPRQISKISSGVVSLAQIRGDFERAFSRLEYLFGDYKHLPKPSWKDRFLWLRQETFRRLDGPLNCHHFLTPLDRALGVLRQPIPPHVVQTVDWLREELRWFETSRDISPPHLQPFFPHDRTGFDANQHLRKLVDREMERLRHGNPLRRLWIPSLDGRRAMDASYNQATVQNVLLQVDLLVGDCNPAARSFYVTDERGCSVLVNITQRALMKLDLVHLIGAAYSGESRLRTGSVAEIFAYLVGRVTESPKRVATVEDIFVPPFAYTSMSASTGHEAFSPYLSSNTDLSFLGTYHIHPGGDELAAPTPLDCSAFDSFRQRFDHRTGRYLFDVMHPKRADWGIYPNPLQTEPFSYPPRDDHPYEELSSGAEPPRSLRYRIYYMDWIV